MNHMNRVFAAIFVFAVAFSINLATAYAEIQIGDQMQFYYYRFDQVPPGTPPNQQPLTATCRLKSDNIYWFVANDAWQQNGFDNDDLTRWYTMFEVSTPGTDGRGVYQIAEDLLGFPRFNDSDRRIFILFHDLGVLPHRCQKFAYFRPEDFDETSDKRNPYDIIYIHAQDLDAEDECHSNTTVLYRRAMPEAIETLAQFMVYGNDAQEVPWVREGLALRLLYLSGYYDGNNSEYDWHTDVQSFAHQPGTRFKETNRGTYYEYNRGALLLFFTYFEQRFGTEGISAVVHSQDTELEGITDAIQARGGSITGEEFFGDFTVANWINAGREYVYTTINVPSFLPTKVIRDIPSEQMVSITSWSTQYVRIPTSELSIDDRIRITATLPACSSEDPPAECSYPEYLLIKAIQVQNPRDVSFVEQVQQDTNEDGHPYFEMNFAGFGPSTPELMITMTRFNEHIIPLNVKLNIELNPEIPVDGDEELEPELEPEEEIVQEVEELEPEPEIEPYIVEKRDRNFGSSSSGCAGSPAGAIYAAIAMLAVWRWKKRFS